MWIRLFCLFLITVCCSCVSAQQANVEIVTAKNVEYGTGAGEPLKLDIAYPAKVVQAAPCIVVIHGGGWRAGSKDGHFDIVQRLAKMGYVSATVQYRFAPKHKFPAQIEDVKCAVRYLRANADKYGIDKTKFGAMGFSAGAHLSMMLGCMGKDDGLEGDGGNPAESSQVQAVVAFFGPTDFLGPDIQPVTDKIVEDFLGGKREEIKEVSQKASPITYVTKDDAATLIYQGTKDPLVPHSQAILMAEALNKAGVKGRVELLLGAGHGWGGKDMERTMRGTEEFFRGQLLGK